MSIYDNSRRRLLKLLAGSLPAALLYRTASGAPRDADAPLTSPNQHNSDTPTIGIALGAGGANGLAHILMLEALDEMHIRPHRIAGSSIGAIIGALYASGTSGRKIRELVEQFIISPEEKLTEELLNSETLRWIEFLEIDLGDGGLLSSEGFITYLYDTLQCDTFEELRIPLKVTAADLWKRTPVVLESGPLLPAIRASMALPGIFQPVMLDDRVLVDGGTVNPVPYDLLTAECDIVIGIDASGFRTPPPTQRPGYFETIFASAKVMQQAIMAEKLRRRKPAVYITPRVTDIRALEFYRAREVFEQAGPARDELQLRLSAILKDW
jgi:NTE family protein